MKKTLLTLMAVVIYLASPAQFRVGAKVGLNFSDQALKYTGKSQDTKFHTELQAGLIGDMKLLGKLYLQPQLLYSRKGSTHESATGGPDTRIKMNYAEVPINLVYKTDLHLGKIYFGAGPVVGYGFGGELVQNGESKKLYSNDIKNFERYDISANAVAGIELPNGLFGSIAYQHGFQDIYKTDDISIKNRTLALSVGILLGKPR
jgi:Outer membrane protein beta-barrel domain